MSVSKFYYINQEQYDAIRDLFILQDPSVKIVLSEYGSYQDVAVFNEKYKTVVFTTTKVRNDA